jgi:chromosomal replication initiator protein
MDPFLVNGTLTIPLLGQALHDFSSGSHDSRTAPKVRPFVVGKENELVPVVVDACLARQEATDDSPPYSPLLLCGPPGSGKSHLALGIASEWQQRRPQARVMAVTAADFARQLHDSADAGVTVSSRARYREADLLVFEDLASLAHKPTAQRELMQLLDELNNSGAQVIVTSRMTLDHLPSLLPGLASRLESGLILPLQLPAAETRRSLLEQLAQERGTSLDPAALQALADGLPVTTPELFGSFTHLEAASAINRTPIDVAQVRKYLGRRTSLRAPSLQRIAAQTARHFGLKVAELRSTSRRRNLVLARDVAMTLARRLTGKSLLQIGEYFGGRDHTTVLHGCRKVESSLRSDPELRQTMEQLQRILANQG